MDTFTNDERREVAEMLRGAAHRHDAIECGSVTNMLGLKYGIYGSVVAFPSDAVSRLADLIDPTCEMEAAGDVPALVKGSLKTFFCSECGSPIYNDVNPSYCLYCGHRVVSDDD